MVDLISEWDTLQREVGDILSDGSDKVPSRRSPCWPHTETGKFLASGMNYQKHRAEAVDASHSPPVDVVHQTDHQHQRPVWGRKNPIRQ